MEGTRLIGVETTAIGDRAVAHLVLVRIRGEAKSQIRARPFRADKYGVNVLVATVGVAP